MAEYKMVKVTIAKGRTHTNAGELLQAGDTCAVWPDTAEWLEEMGVIEPLKKKAPSKTEPGDE